MDVIKLVVIQFDSMWVVVENNGARFNIPRRILPTQLKKGDIVTAIFGVNTEDTDPVKLRQHVSAS